MKILHKYSYFPINVWVTVWIIAAFRMRDTGNPLRMVGNINEITPWHLAVAFVIFFTVTIGLTWFAMRGISRRRVLDAASMEGAFKVWQEKLNPGKIGRITDLTISSFNAGAAYGANYQKKQ